MNNDSLQSYLRVNEAFYWDLVEKLASEISTPKDSSDLLNARRHYFSIAIAKGMDLSEIPEDLQSLSPTQILKAAKALPDKQNRFSGEALNEEERQKFAEAAKRRSPEMNWDNLFTNGKDDLIIEFSTGGHAAGEKIEAYIEQHNKAAVEQLAAAREKDRQTELKYYPDPVPKNERPKAGKSIDHRQIRIDPDNPLCLQTLNPNKPGEAWETGPKLGKFFQDKSEWVLYDLVDAFRREKTPQTKETSDDTASIELKDIANRDEIYCDELLKQDALTIVISRDPQKIGEMSTGQRWKSCMSIDGVNYHYVTEDIEAGTLVAYVVHKDDPQARYPLMRTLLKPYRNAKGETILVPSKIYGGEGYGSSQTRENFVHTLRDFVSEHNPANSGEFTMDPKLYADGQALTVVLNKKWSKEVIQNAMLEYRNGAIEEWVTELNDNADWVNRGLLGNHGENPATNVKNFKNKIRNIMNVDDKENGLPRTFFREVTRSSIGTLPDVTDVIEAAATHKDLKAQNEAFKALLNKDENGWLLAKQNLPADTRRQLCTYALITAADNSDAKPFFTQNYLNEINTLSEPKERVDAIVKNLREFTHCLPNEHKQAMGERLSTEIPLLNTPMQRILAHNEVALIFTDKKQTCLESILAETEKLDDPMDFLIANQKISDLSDSYNFKRSREPLVLKRIESVGSASDKMKLYGEFIYSSLDHNSTEICRDHILKEASDAPPAEAAHMLGIFTKDHLGCRSDLVDPIKNKFFEIIKTVPDAKKRAEIYGEICSTSVGIYPFNQQCMDNLHQTMPEIPDNSARIEIYKNMLNNWKQHYIDGSPLAQETAEALFKYTSLETDAFKRIESYNHITNLPSDAILYSDIKATAKSAISSDVDALVKNIKHLPNTQKKIDECLRIIEKGNNPFLIEQVSGIALKNIYELNSRSQRLEVAQKIIDANKRLQSQGARLPPLFIKQAENVLSPKDLSRRRFNRLKGGKIDNNNIKGEKCLASTAKTFENPNTPLPADRNRQRAVQTAKLSW